MRCQVWSVWKFGKRSENFGVLGEVKGEGKGDGEERAWWCFFLGKMQLEFILELRILAFWASSWLIFDSL
ncbi:unnamed protein product [Moneuplotes crassus]|uniref:Uncharacterized protein n=1 Tax=Euplotes crassus TaxID=5936 RepID=A0AAD1XT29_EUPCR|nr:unnamed protein product [Moneuplotes crassus]